MALHHFPRITTDGLVLCLDAGNPLSYTSGDSVWKDLSGNGNNGTLVNSPTFDAENRCFNYSYVNLITVPMVGLRPVSAITQESWVSIGSNVAQVFIGSQYGTGSNNSYALWLNGANTWTAGVNITGSFNYSSYTQTINLNTWYHFVHTYDGSNQKLYLNGSLVHSWATTGSIIYNTNNTLLAIGNDFNGTGYDTNATVGIRGKLSNIKIYNRSLSATEIQNNYLATKGRYGL